MFQKQMSEPINTCCPARRLPSKAVKSAGKGSTSTLFSAAVTCRKGNTSSSKSTPVTLA